MPMLMSGEFQTAQNRPVRDAAELLRQGPRDRVRAPRAPAFRVQCQFPLKRADERPVVQLQPPSCAAQAGTLAQLGTAGSTDGTVGHAGKSSPNHARPASSSLSDASQYASARSSAGTFGS